MISIAILAKQLLKALAMSVGLVTVTLLTVIAVEKRWLGLFEDVFFLPFHIIFRFLIFFFFLKKSGKIKLLLF